MRWQLPYMCSCHAHPYSAQRLTHIPSGIAANVQARTHAHTQKGVSTHLQRHILYSAMRSQMHVHARIECQRQALVNDKMEVLPGLSAALKNSRSGFEQNTKQYVNQNNAKV